MGVLTTTLIVRLDFNADANKIETWLKSLRKKSWRTGQKKHGSPRRLAGGLPDIDADLFDPLAGTLAKGREGHHQQQLSCSCAWDATLCSWKQSRAVSHREAPRSHPTAATMPLLSAIASGISISLLATSYYPRFDNLRKLAGHAALQFGGKVMQAEDEIAASAAYSASWS